MVVVEDGGSGWAEEELAAAWRAARSSIPAGYLNAAACNVSSDAVLAAVAGHLDRVRAVGSYVAAAEAASTLDEGRAALAACVGAAAADVGFVEKGRVPFATVLAGWGLAEGARVAVVGSEFRSKRMFLDRLAAQRGWAVVELAVDGYSRIDLEGLARALRGGLDLVTFPHIAAHRGIVQPAQEAGRLCRDAGVPLVLDVCQSFGHVDVSGIGAAAYLGTSQRWLAGPRGAGFVIAPGLAERAGADARGLLMSDAARDEGDGSDCAANVGLSIAAQEHRALGPAAVYARLAAIGRAARGLLDGVGGWTVAEPIGEPTAIVTLRPPRGADPGEAVAGAAAAAAGAGLQVGVIAPGRAVSDLPTPVLRLSLPVGASSSDVETLAMVLAQ